jgi:uncharacterized membrane protein YvbJ
MSRYCRNCGNPIEETQQYCTRCGMPSDNCRQNAPYNAGCPAQSYNSFAITGFCLSLGSLVLPYVGILAAVLGIIFSAIAKKQLIEKPENGRNLANAGLIVGIIVTVFWIILIGFLTAGFMDALFYYL